MNQNTKYIIITPARDEAAYIASTIACVISQTIRPSEWIIVDDGSTDDTGKIIDGYAPRISWIKTVHRKNRGLRKAGGGVIEAFYEGLDAVSSRDWQFIVKLDGDLSFQADYFERCFREFAKDPKLGIAGGDIYHSVNGQLKLEKNPRFHVRGATKIYRRECWNQIGPLVRAAGWDTIDEVKANMRGWSTCSFSDVKLTHLKPIGSADGRWRNWFKNGRADYIAGYHPVFMMAKCIKRAFQIPPFLEAMGIMSGYVTAYLKGIPRVGDPDLILYIRREQMRRLLLRPSIWK